ncbi:MAG: CsgG/HfaB family protein [Pseudomonadota bacterium]
MNGKLTKTILSMGILSISLAGCAGQMSMGDPAAKTEATGSAGGSNSQGANAKLEHCDRPIGTLAVIEDQDAEWFDQLTRTYHLGSTVPVIKLLVQQSNCFVIVDRGAGLQMGMSERALNDTGEMRKTSKLHKGQIVAADYALNPSITFSSSDTGGIGAALANYGGGWLGLLAGGLKFKEASTMLTLSDNRSSVQLASAEGSAKNTDYSIFGGAFGSSLGGTAGGYSKTPEGKVIVAAFTDSYNNIVRSVKNYKTQSVQGGLGAGGNLAVQGEDDDGSQEEAPAKTVSKKKKTKK